MPAARSGSNALEGDNAFRIGAVRGAGCVREREAVKAYKLAAYTVVGVEPDVWDDAALVVTCVFVFCIIFIGFYAPGGNQARGGLQT